MIEKRFKEGKNGNKIIITTEKDWMRLREIEENCLLLHPVFSIPIEIGFIEKEDSFMKIIKDYVRKD